MKPILAKLLSEKVESLPMEQGPRMHLGASKIGKECVRALWYDFRWASNIKKPNRLLRLFNRGHREEAIFEKLLKDAGCELYTIDATTGEQFRFSDCEGHFGGSLDGIITGVPDMPNEWMLLEMKTSADQYFKKLFGWISKIKKYLSSKGIGIFNVWPDHYYQMQMYMHKKGLRWALYCSVNKNDDKLYFELIPYDPSCIPALEDKTKVAIYSEEIPPKITNNPSSHKCVMCDHKGICQLNEHIAKNCRTCESIVMLPEGKWKCGLTEKQLEKKDLIYGCEHYELSGKFN
jgi:hypothetical protein